MARDCPGSRTISRVQSRTISKLDTRYLQDMPCSYSVASSHSVTRPCFREAHETRTYLIPRYTSHVRPLREKKPGPTERRKPRARSGGGYRTRGGPTGPRRRVALPATAAWRGGFKREGGNSRMLHPERVALHHACYTHDLP